MADTPSDKIPPDLSRAVSTAALIKVDRSYCLRGWLIARRVHSTVVFVDMQDEDGTVQLVATADSAAGNTLTSIPLESSVIVEGNLELGQNGHPELRVQTVVAISEAILPLSPRPHEVFDPFEERHADNVLSNRHLYMRNPVIVAAMKLRAGTTFFLHSWFRERSFISLDAPVLTPIPLYEDHTAIAVRVHEEDLFLTQCVGYYLEAAAHGLGKVYNMGPSFRGEHSKSRRHLKEYWHIKAEIAFTNRDTLIDTVEQLLADVAQYVDRELSSELRRCGAGPIDERFSRPPYERITYDDARELLAGEGHRVASGQRFSADQEDLLTSLFGDCPVWLTDPPLSLEPFPYVPTKSNPPRTRTADLLAPFGFGEILGVAEKIYDLVELENRMREAGRWNDPRYQWIVELRQYGCVPHGGFGIGLERLLRWLGGFRHVRDVSPFPRVVGRSTYP